MSEHDREYGYEKMLYYDADFFDCILFFTWCMKKLSKNRFIILVFPQSLKYIIWDDETWKIVHDDPKNWPNYLYIDSLFIIDYWVFANEKLIILFAIHSFLYLMQYLIFMKEICSLLCFENYNFRFYSCLLGWFISSMYSVHIT